MSLPSNEELKQGLYFIMTCLVYSYVILLFATFIINDIRKSWWDAKKDYDYRNNRTN